MRGEASHGIMRETFEVGATVVATDGQIGTVDEIVTDPVTGDPHLLVVRTADAERIEVPYSLIGPDSTERQVRLAAARDVVLGGPGVTAAEGPALEAVGDRLVVPVREEVLVPTTRPIELGEVRIHKRVETVPYETLVDVRRDDIAVERIAINQPVDAVPAPRQEGETLVIPVVEEVLVTEKRLLLREEIRVTRRQITEAVPVRDTVRREVVEIEDPEGTPLRAGEPLPGKETPGRSVGADDLPLT